MREKAKRTFQVPHTYTIIFILMIIVAVMTWVVPSGTFATTEIDGREVTVAGTYEQMDKTFVDGETGKQVDLRQGPGAVLEAPIAGIMAAAEVGAFVFIVGGAFQIITATGAIDAGMRRQETDEALILTINIPKARRREPAPKQAEPVPVG